MKWPPDIGKRRQFVLRVLSDRGRYAEIRFRAADALYVSSPSLVYTVVPSEIDTEYGDSEIAWTDIGEIRLWGALAFSLLEGSGFFCFYPLDGQLILAESLDEDVVQRAAQRVSARLAPQQHELNTRRPSQDSVGALYEALLKADNVILRGVNCYLKSFMLWEHPFFREEMGLNLYISLEAGLSVIRRRLSAQGGRDVSYEDVFDFVRATFPHGDGLAEYWEDCHDDRTILVHPDNRFGARVMHPSMADDIYELLDPMLSLYRYILIGEPPPERPGPVGG